MTHEKLSPKEIAAKQLVLRATDLNFGFRRKRKGLYKLNPINRGVNWILGRDISFEIEANSYTALVGPSGSGKTTLFSIISSRNEKGLVSKGKINFSEKEGNKTKLSINHRHRLSQIHIQSKGKARTIHLIDELFLGKNKNQILVSVLSFAANKDKQDGGAIIFATHNLPRALAEIVDNILILGPNPQFGKAEEMISNPYVKRVLTD